MIIIAWNLEYAKATTPEKVAKELEPFHPDVVCLCETPNGEWTAEMAGRLGMPHCIVGLCNSFSVISWAVLMMMLVMLVESDVCSSGLP